MTSPSHMPNISADFEEALEAQQKAEKKKMRRRTFLKWGGGITAGLVVGVGLAYQNRFLLIQKALDYAANKDYNAGAFIVIPTKGKFKLICHRSEMGQGVRTSLPMILADELDVPWDDIEIIQAQGDPKYGSQNTDGSTSIRQFYERLRKAAAGTREILVEVAARRWNVPTRDCITRQGQVVHPKTKRSFDYRALAKDAADLDLPHNPTLKSPKDFKYIGKPRPSIDLSSIIQGQATYGADIKLKGMVYAAGVRSPVPWAKLKRYDATEAKKIKGVKQVLTVESYGTTAQNNAAVFVVANNTWTAFKGAKAIKAEWDNTGLKIDSSPAYREELERALGSGKKLVYRSDGDVDHAEQNAFKTVQASYFAPFMVHAQMEPLVATAQVKGKTCEVWAPTQDPMRARKAIAKMLGFKLEDVTLHVTMLGGGFGRKGQPDFVIEAVALAKQLKQPVRVQWSREDDTKHGFYHAESYQRLTATLDKEGMPRSWRHQVNYPSIVNIIWPVQDGPSVFEVSQGALDLPYRIPNISIEAGKTLSTVRVGWFRSVCHIFQSFSINSFLDELAEHANMDPIDYRLKLLGRPRKVKPLLQHDYPENTGRMIDVMRKVRDAFGWDKPLPKGHGKGFANLYSFYSYVALALEASCENNIIKIHRVVCAIDCGLAVNPESVRAQMEGAVVFGLTAALYGKITLKDGVVEQSNYHDAPVLRINEMPKVEVHIINGDPSRPTGVGEPGVPVVAPALASAIYQITGKRLRDLPLAEKLLS